ncbi:MAG: hypothetical protein IT488_01360 [Gammaproteobacteria bacterium]|nr:hypothetical protein [Gammaproteobacteria bacterium]
MTLQRIIYAAPDAVTVSVYDGRSFLGEIAFGGDESGLSELGEYFAQEPHIISRLLVDMIEEEYRVDTMPHVIGRDRQAVLSRKLEQTFRASPYRAAQVQGRQDSGRRDDRVLLAALTNPDAIGVLAAPLAKNQAPLAGIHSVALLAQPLLQGLKISGDNVLLLTGNRQGFLRQTFLHKRELKNSRLSPMGRDDFGPAPLAQEIEKNRRYLNRLRVLAHDAPLDVVVIGARALVDQLRAAWEDKESTRYHLIDYAVAAKAVGLVEAVGEVDCERLFTHLLNRANPAFNYAPTPDRRVYRLYQARKALLATSLGMVLGGAAWAGVNVMDGINLGRQSDLAAHTIESLREDYAAATADGPDMNVGVDEMRWMVDAGEMLQHSSAAPWEMLRALSVGISAHPSIRIDEIDWSASLQEGYVNTADLALTDSEGAEASAGEMAILKGRVDPFAGDYREAFNRVEAFMKTLRRDPRFSAVNAMAMPLNVNPDAVIAGMAGGQSDNAPAIFEIRVVMRAGHEDA